MKPLRSIDTRVKIVKTDRGSITGGNPMKRRVVGVDLDNVLKDCYVSLCTFHNRRFGTTLNKEDGRNYSLEEVWGCTLPEVYARLAEFFQSTEHHEAQPISGAQQAIRLLQKRYDVVVITARPVEAQEVTHAWMVRNFPTLTEHVHYMGGAHGGAPHKTKGDVCKEFGVSFFVEDAIHHVESVAPVVEHVFLFDAPWNRNHQLPFANVTRVVSWSDIRI